MRRGPGMPVCLCVLRCQHCTTVLQINCHYSGSTSPFVGACDNGRRRVEVLVHTQGRTHVAAGNENAEIGRLHETIAHQTAVVEAQRREAAVGRCVPGNVFQLEIRPCNPRRAFCCSLSAREPRPMGVASRLSPRRPTRHRMT